MNNTAQPRACPFCGCGLQWQEGNLKITPPLFPLWRHPRNGCFAEMFAVVPEDVGKWNRRAARDA